MEARFEFLTARHIVFGSGMLIKLANDDATWPACIRRDRTQCLSW